jgi:hypothetical protein
MEGVLGVRIHHHARIHHAIRIMMCKPGRIARQSGAGAALRPQPRTRGAGKLSATTGKRERRYGPAKFLDWRDVNPLQ